MVFEKFLQLQLSWLRIKKFCGVQHLSVKREANQLFSIQVFKWCAYVGTDPIRSDRSRRWTIACIIMCFQIIQKYLNICYQMPRKPWKISCVLPVMIEILLRPSVKFYVPISVFNLKHYFKMHFFAMIFCELIRNQFEYET